LWLAPPDTSIWTSRFYGDLLGCLQMRATSTSDLSRTSRFHGRNNNFNLLRMLAAICVLISHSFRISLGAHSREPLEASLGMSLGTLAVVRFFAISGYFISQSFDKSLGALISACGSLFLHWKYSTSIVPSSSWNECLSAPVVCQFLMEHRRWTCCLRISLLPRSMVP
jgi:hypothetical protein